MEKYLNLATNRRIRETDRRGKNAEINVRKRNQVTEAMLKCKPKVGDVKHCFR